MEQEDIKRVIPPRAWEVSNDDRAPMFSEDAEDPLAFFKGLVVLLLTSALVAVVLLALFWGWTATGDACPGAPTGWLGWCNAEEFSR